MFRADLHCHSTYSDGTMTPIELLEHAKEKQLSAISITDHDTIDAYTDEAYKKAEELNVRLLPGIELSSRHEEYPVHILGYGYKKADALLELCDKHQTRRENRNRGILEMLKKKGFDVSEEEVLQLAPERSIGRPHIAKLLIDKGYVSSIQEAFDLYLGEGKCCFEIGVSFTPEETIDVIHAASGKAFIAHPHLIRTPKVIEDLLKMNFDGIECYYGLYHHGQEKEWLNVTKKRGWLVSGGSDFHGSVKPHIRLGCSWVGEEMVNNIFGEL